MTKTEAKKGLKAPSAKTRAKSVEPKKVGPIFVDQDFDIHYRIAVASAKSIAARYGK
jgi:hypothetical protein